MDRCLKQDGSADPEVPVFARHAIASAVDTLANVMGRLSHSDVVARPIHELSSADSQLMQAPSFVTAIGLLLAIVGYNLLLENGSLPGLLDSSSATSSSSSSSSSASAASNHRSSSRASSSASNATRSWYEDSAPSSSHHQLPVNVDAATMLRQASKSAAESSKAWRACQQSRLLPPTHKQLLQLLGVGDCRVLVWMAQLIRRQKLGAFVQVADVFTNFLAAASQEQSAESPPPLPPLLHNRQLQQLAAIGGHLLYFSSHYNFPDMLGFSATCVIYAASNLLVHGKPGAVRLLSQQQQQQGVGSSDSQRQLAPVLVVRQALSLMPTVLSRLLAVMTQHSNQRADGAASSAAALDTGGASSSSSGGRGPGTPAAISQRIACLERQLAVLLNASRGVPFQDVVIFDSSTSPGVSGTHRPSTAAAAAAGTDASTSALSDVAAEWRLHAVHLTPQLEAYMRCAAAESRLPHASAAASSNSNELHMQQVSKLTARVGLGLLLVPDVHNPADYGHLLAAAISVGCGSVEQHTLVSLLCSFLKLHAAVVMPTHTEQHMQQSGLQDTTTLTTSLLLAVARSAVALVKAAAAAAAAPEHQHVLPWLNIFGRCCLQLSGQLTVATISLLHPDTPDKSVLLHMQSALHNYLQQPGVSDRLCAAGYDVGPVQPQFAAAEAALEAVRHGGSVDSTQPEGAQLQDSLQDLGTALCALAVTTLLCNNPGCSNVVGASETQLVNGKSCVCGGCLVARYCNRNSCQRPHWKQHKQICKALAAATAASVAVVEAAVRGVLAQGAG